MIPAKYFLYHLVPKNIRGDILYPLNILKGIYPDIYQYQVNKYFGREYIIEQRIPLFNCLWNDVLQFSAINPKDIKQALIEAGHKPNLTMRFYQFDACLLKPKNTLIYLFSDSDGVEMNENDFVPYSLCELEKCGILPQRTKDYHKDMVRARESPLLFYGVPHILYKGILNISNMKVIEV